MGSPLLILRLEGPLQSWGLRARWDVRDTGDEPSKSALVGLLGCALGYPAGDPRLEALEQALSMGVRVERRGLKLVDFQTVSGVMPTAEGGKKGTSDDPNTIISPRTYLQDAAFLVVLFGPPDLLERCRAALSRPRWPVYLGRKSCPPTRPVVDSMTDQYSSVDEALRLLPWDWDGRSPQSEVDPTEPLRCVLDDPKGEALRPDRLRTTPVRMYDPRPVTTFTVAFPGAAAREDGETCTSPS